MDIVIGKIQPGKKEGSKKHSVFPGDKKTRKDRKKTKHDRRQNARDGFIVSLSFKSERRVLPDRRKSVLQSNPYTT